MSISTYKNNGYGWGNDMGGLWTFTAEASPDVVFVEFYLDNQLQLNATVAPFKWQFNTADYALGEHTIKVVAYDSSGLSATAEKQANFVEYSFTDTLVIIVAAFIVVIVVALAVLLYRVRRKASTNNTK
ncbi:MAG: Ig-like domain-containing protein [Betaproteobacteria bacterium]